MDVSFVPVRGSLAFPALRPQGRRPRRPCKNGHFAATSDIYLPAVTSRDVRGSARVSTRFLMPVADIKGNSLNRSAGNAPHPMPTVATPCPDSGVTKCEGANAGKFVQRTRAPGVGVFATWLWQI